MKKYKNWREILGWVVIILFAYLYAYQKNNFYYNSNVAKDDVFKFFVTVTLFILIWLRVNKKV